VKRKKGEKRKGAHLSLLFLSSGRRKKKGRKDLSLRPSQRG